MPVDLAEKLKNGEVGLLPSDTIYGLSCRALDQKAVEKIYELKGRDDHKPLIILLADANQAEELHVDPELLCPANKYWPAPLTVVVDATDAPEWLTRGQTTLALRVPANAELRDVIKQTGPIISTSANPQDQKPAANVAEAKTYFGKQLDFYIDAGKLESKPSTVARLKNGRFEILRQGDFKIGVR